MTEESTPTAGAAGAADVAARFEAADDRGKVAIAEADLRECREGLDQILSRLEALKVRAEDPDGVVAVTLGSDGRLVGLWIDRGATSRFTHLELEDKVNDCCRDALEELNAARAEINAAAINFLPAA